MGVAIIAEGEFASVDISTFYPGYSEFAETPSHKRPLGDWSNTLASQSGSSDFKWVRKQFRRNGDTESTRNELDVLGRLNALQHPNIVKLLGSYSFQNNSFLVFPVAECDLCRQSSPAAVS